MPCARPDRGGGWRPSGPGFLICAALALGCTSPNPFFNDLDGGLTGRGGAGGTAGGTGGGDGAATGGISGPGGSNPTGTGGSTGGSSSGGATGTGGTGGSSPTGGTGGSPATGGTGGSSPTGGTGGSPATGGTGGSSPAGGTGGSSAAGGTGGSSAAGGTGGSSATGGTGGSSATGGTGGSSATGGTGGSSATGGAGGSLQVMGPPPDMCGTGAQDVAGISAARGIVVETNGTIYFTQQNGRRGYIGRLVPGQAPEPQWFEMPGNSAQPRLLRIDSRRQIVFASDGGQSLLIGAGPTTGTPSTRISTGGLPDIHGLAVAADSSIWASCGDGYVYRIVADLAIPSSTKTTVTPIFATGRPLGLAFGPTGQLYVGSSNGRIKRFSVTNNMLTDGADYGQWSGTANDLAFDVHGRLYVSDATGGTAHATVVIAPDGGASPLGPTGMLSGLGFGRGTLSCLELYISDLVGPARRLTALGTALKTP